MIQFLDVNGFALVLMCIVSALLGFLINYSENKKQFNEYINLQKAHDELKCLKTNNLNSPLTDVNKLNVNYLVSLNSRYSKLVNYTDNGLYVITQLIFRKDTTIVALLAPAALYEESKFCTIKVFNYACDISFLDFHLSYELYQLYKQHTDI